MCHRSDRNFFSILCSLIQSVSGVRLLVPMLQAEPLVAWLVLSLPWGAVPGCRRALCLWGGCRGTAAGRDRAGAALAAGESVLKVTVSTCSVWLEIKANFRGISSGQCQGMGTCMFRSEQEGSDFKRKNIWGCFFIFAELTLVFWGQHCESRICFKAKQAV